MTREFRSFQFDGATHRLAEEPRVREGDLRDGALTLLREPDGERRVIRAADINVPLPAAVPPIAPERLYDLRVLVEQALALGFTDDEIIEILEIARTHCLLRVPENREDRR
jgi:hypothetical protein